MPIRAMTPTLDAGRLAALFVGVLLAAVVSALDTEDVVVVIETAGELVGAAVIKLPLDWVPEDSEVEDSV